MALRGLLSHHNAPSWFNPAGGFFSFLIPMTATTLLTELQALNTMLTAADEAPVQTASQPGHLPLTIAKGVLDDTSRTVQSVGWTFNTEYKFPLTRNVDGTITVAPNVLSLDTDDFGGSVDPVQRGSQLYDRKNHRYTFERDLTATIIFLLPWDLLPQAARQYITIKAARIFQARMQAGEGVFAMTAEQEEAALLALQSHEADSADANFLTDSYSVASVLAGRGYPTFS